MWSILKKKVSHRFDKFNTERKVNKLSKKYFSLILLSVLVVILLASIPAKAQEVTIVSGDVGRYRAVPISELGFHQILFLDTKEGHLWYWSKKKGIQYQGPLRPAEKMADVPSINRTKKDNERKIGRR